MPEHPAGRNIITLHAHNRLKAPSLSHRKEHFQERFQKQLKHFLSIFSKTTLSELCYPHSFYCVSHLCIFVQFSGDTV